MSEFKKYIRTGIAEMRPVTKEELDTSMFDSTVSISDADFNNGSPLPGDMIARNPLNHNDQWLVAAPYFTTNFKPFKEH
jgi:hypothetical protein